MMNKDFFIGGIMKETIIKIEKALQNELKNVQDLVALNSLKINYLGKRGK